MSLVCLTVEESKVFFDIIDSELRSVVNEYDSNTGRRPSKKRIEEGHYAKSIMDKWVITQNMIPNTTFVNLDTINACKLDLTVGEKGYIKRLVQKFIENVTKELSGYNMPYTGVLKQLDDMRNVAELILRKVER